MNPLVLQFANGNALFAGFLLAVVACALRLRPHNPIIRGVLTVLIVAGGICEDGLHLSKIGHDKMASVVRDLIE